MADSGVIVPVGGSYQGRKASPTIAQSAILVSSSTYPRNSTPSSYEMDPDVVNGEIGIGPRCSISWRKD